MHRTARPLRAVYLALLVVAAATLPAGSTLAAKADPGYAIYRTGSATDVTTTSHSGGLLLAGGGTDSEAGMRWLLAQGGSPAGKTTFGDVVVLGAVIERGWATGYNKYFTDRGANSVTAIATTSLTGANSPLVEAAIGTAEIIFISRGDQSKYVTQWTGSKLQVAVNKRVGVDHYPIGGTSAGLAVLGGYVFAALNGTAYSDTVLANPYDATVSIKPALFASVPLLGNVITDSHFFARDRMGRLVTFLARLQLGTESGTPHFATPRGIGIDEASAVAVRLDGVATVYGSGLGAYFLNTVGASGACLAGQALIYAPVAVVHVPVGKQFNASSWEAINATAVPASTSYTLTAGNGALTSTTGQVY